mmetsp:Transcript_64863/g.159652  ORF Transcript_64863/g.159652 Transcript_64863/m.159652 type:complete len:220 (-) Transcript_64863:37-696(-)
MVRDVDDELGLEEDVEGEDHAGAALAGLVALLVLCHHDLLGEARHAFVNDKDGRERVRLLAHVVAAPLLVDLEEEALDVVGGELVLLAREEHNSTPPLVPRLVNPHGELEGVADGAVVGALGLEVGDPLVPVVVLHLIAPVGQQGPQRLADLEDPGEVLYGSAVVAHGAAPPRGALALSSAPAAPGSRGWGAARLDAAHLWPPCPQRSGSAERGVGAGK